MTCIVRPTPSNVSVPQLSWPVVVVLIAFFNVSKPLGQIFLSAYNTSPFLLFLDSLIHELVDHIAPSQDDVPEQSGPFPRRDIPMPIFSSARCWFSPWFGSTAPQILDDTSLRDR